MPFHRPVIPMQYVRYGIPATPKPGKVLVHNHIQHEPDTPVGINGFSAWWSKWYLPDHIECDCGWAPRISKHYRMRQPRFDT
jgi:hypothetical protein